VEFTETYETKLVVAGITERLNGFSKIEHIDALKNYFLPKISDFADKIDVFYKSNENIRQCVR
jgi:hypothetical protein